MDLQTAGAFVGAERNDATRSRNAPIPNFLPGKDRAISRWTAASLEGDLGDAARAGPASAPTPLVGRTRRAGILSRRATQLRAGKGGRTVLAEIREQDPGLMRDY